MIFASEDGAPIALDLMPDWAAMLGPSAADLELEIGSGHGGYALAFARERPGRALVAIEQRRKFADELRARAERRGHRSLVVVNGDARLLAPRLFRPRSLSAIHVHFPDPWWKRKHHRRRLVDDRMTVLLRSLLRPGGLLDLRTNGEGYGVEALALLEEAGFENEAGGGRFAETSTD